MRLAISHTTRYEFSDPIYYGLQRLRLRPKPTHGQTVVDWQMEFDGQCPHTTLPSREFWEAVAPAAARQSGPVGTPLSAARMAVASTPDFAATAPFSVSMVQTIEQETQQDLEDLFKVRDNAMAQLSHPPVGYESTQPAHL